MTPNAASPPDPAGHAAVREASGGCAGRLSRLFGRLGAALVDRLAPYAADEPQAGTFRAKQLQAVLRLTPLTMLANVANGSVICVAFWESAHRLLIAAWFLFVLLMAASGVRAWKVLRAGHLRPVTSRRSLRRLTLHSALLAGLWAVVIAALFPLADSPRQLLLAVIATGMICAGGFALATVPLAGTAFVLVLCAGSFVAIFDAHFELAAIIGPLLLLYGFIVISSVISMAKSFGARLTAEAEAERQNEVIGLLLRDFEENASDVLWEIDASGHFAANSPRWVAALGISELQRLQHPAIDLLAQRHPPVPGSELGGITLLQAHLDACTAFRDLVLRLDALGGTRWWSLSAKPLLDRSGQCVGWRGVATDVTQNQIATDRLTYLAHFDALTGLTNRHQFRAQLAGLLLPGSALARRFAVLCLDLDHFKTVNDTLGHAVGDALLQTVAQRLVSICRADDFVGRLGGDEFGIILRDAESIDAVANAAARLLDALQQPCEIQGATISVRSSVGIAMAPRDGLQVDQLLKNADVALYEAKSVGRGSFRFFEPQMADLTRRRMVIEQSLRGALARGEFSLRYQPQIHVNDWRVTGFEALLRWHHPVLGEVGPAEFIPVAEDAGLIMEIGSWVLRQACEQARVWPPEMHVAVNVSAVQVMSQSLPAEVARVLEDTGLAPSQLELEITESVFLNETQTSMQVLHAVHAMGVRVALDDFGTGYSSLAYLRRFPFHTLKVDRSFVRELVTRRDARAIVKTVVGLARTLNMDTVAEGVEQPEQLEVLQRYGCNTVQGYFVSEPMMAGDVVPFLQDWLARQQPHPTDPPQTELLPLSNLYAPAPDDSQRLPLNA
jgi:diguanylate cyclase (GGDEF)-like protein